MAIFSNYGVIMYTHYEVNNKILIVILYFQFLLKNKSILFYSALINMKLSQTIQEYYYNL